MESLIASLSETGRPLAALILASLVIMGSPGPSTISVTAVGASFGVRRSLRYTGGLIAGTIAVLLMVAMGVVALVTSVPHCDRVLSVVSAAYILFLAYRIATAPPLERQKGRVAAPPFTGGVLLAVANPKAWLAIAAVFAGTTVIAGNHSLDAVVKIALLSLMIVIIHLFWLVAGVSLSRFLHEPGTSRLFNLSMAVVLVMVTLIAVVT